MNIFKNKRIDIKGNDIYLYHSGLFKKKSEEVLGVLKFETAIPELKIFEENTFLKTFKVETLLENPDLTGQFLHYSVRILENDAVMIDGIISKSAESCPSWQDANYEAIRLQPFYFKSSDSKNQELIRKGFFDRGLHFAGTITPTAVRNICICDFCNTSFTIQHIHTGFADCEYFYSADSKKTLLVGNDKIGGFLKDETDFKKFEESIDATNKFRYLNNFKCPHCLKDFIDFEQNLEKRKLEYYGNKYINEDFESLK